MPATRSANTRQRASAFIIKKEQGVDENDSSEGSAKLLQAITDSIENHAQAARHAVDQLKRRIESDKRRNEELERQLEAARRTNTQSPPSSDDDINLADIELWDLKKKLKQAQSENAKLKKHIQKLEAEKLLEEVEDLNATPTSEDVQENDDEYQMRKWLRKFTDLMTAPTLPEDFSERCPRCKQVLRLEECSALKCQHMICHKCLPRWHVSIGATETVRCFTCEVETFRENIELVHMSEKDRWDGLLNIVREWVEFDIRREQDTSEEEAEENFIVDEISVSSTASEIDNKSSIDESETHHHATPEADHDSSALKLPYSQSPMKDKRRKMELLQEERRSQKRRRT